MHSMPNSPRRAWSTPMPGRRKVPTDGQSIGDALPPAIPVDANGRGSSLH